jgi:hypothetical protein
MHAGHYCCVRVGDCCVARVVEVAAQRHAVQCWQQLLDERSDLRRHGDADRVGDSNLDRFGSSKTLSDLDDTRRRYFAFERTAERTEIVT